MGFWIGQFTQDLRYGLRGMLRSPGFSLVAIIALALGIGANTAIFSVVNAVLLRPLEYRDADRLVTLLHGGNQPVAPANYLDWREQSKSFEGMGAAEGWGANLSGTDTPEHLVGLRVSVSMFPLLGVEPVAGRVFVDGEDQKGSDHRVVLSYALWQRRFGGERSAVGKTMLLDGEAYTIVGVMPPQFRFAPFWITRAELWAPLPLGDRAQSRGGNSLRVFARLKPAVSLTAARTEIAGITARLEQAYPASNRDVQVTPLKEKVVGKIQQPLLVMLGAVGFVLLIACANVAHMLLARAASRQKEMALRAALGASRGRVVRQLVAENLLLAVAGAAAGTVLAIAAIRALVALRPAGIPRIEAVGLDAQVTLFLLAVTGLTAALFGLAPAMQASVVNLAGALKEGGRSGSDGIGRNRMRSALVSSEFALALMLLVGAGLMVRSLAAMQSINPGFDSRGVLSMVVSVAGSREAEPNQRAVFYPQMLERVRALPGVQSAATINHLPLAGDVWGVPFRIEGRAKPQPGESPRGIYRVVMPGYFETMRIPVMRGRTIRPSDNLATPGVVMINERAAKLYWPGEEALGKRLTLDDEGPAMQWLTVIGVINDVRESDWTSLPEPAVYLATMQSPKYLNDPAPHMAYTTLVVRTTGDPGAMAKAVKEAVWSFDRNLPLSEVLTMDGVLAKVTAPARFQMLLLSSFAAVALLLAAIGIYGVMSYSVSKRRQELGIRMSLGATQGEVLRLVMRQGLTLALAGSVVGIAGAFALSRLMAGMLYSVKPTDPLTFGGVSALLLLVAALATLIPARQATSIDPVIALRNE